MTLISNEKKQRIREITTIIENANVTKLSSEKKRIQQQIVPNIVEDILRRRGFQYEKIRLNKFTVQTTLGSLSIRCCNYFDDGMNKAIMEEEARDVVRYIIVAGHETQSPGQNIIYFNLTNSKRNAREDLYEKELHIPTYDRLDTYISSYVPAT